VIRLSLLVLLAGCDKLFDLEHVSRKDAGGDGDNTPDGDAFVCNAIGHDEDTDTLDDACDTCPTFAGTATMDMDTDGLPDECDRNNAPTGADKILHYWSFSRDDRTDFAITGGTPTYLGTNNGSIVVGANTIFETTDPYPLTRVDFHVAGIMLPGGTAVVDVQIGGVTLCTVSGGACSGTGTGTCLRFGAGAQGTWPLASTSARRLSVYRDGDRVMCEITDGSNGVPVGTTTTLVAGSVGVVTNASSSVRIEAIVIYGGN
jgi:hypothetical protein